MTIPTGYMTIPSPITSNHIYGCFFHKVVTAEIQKYKGLEGSKEGFLMKHKMDFIKLSFSIIMYSKVQNKLTVSI